MILICDHDLRHVLMAGMVFSLGVMTLIVLL